MLRMTEARLDRSFGHGLFFGRGVGAPHQGKIKWHGPICQRNERSEISDYNEKLMRSERKEKCADGVFERRSSRNSFSIRMLCIIFVLWKCDTYSNERQWHADMTSSRRWLTYIFMSVLVFSFTLWEKRRKIWLTAKYQKSVMNNICHKLSWYQKLWMHKKHTIHTIPCTLLYWCDRIMRK